MPEPDNDKLEGFFRKAASKPDIAFNENDWKKLEARLNEKGTHLSVFKKISNKIIGAVFLFVLLISSSVFWLTRDYEEQPEVAKANNAGELLGKNGKVSDAGSLSSKSGSTSDENNNDRILQKRIPVPKEGVAAAEILDIVPQKKSLQQTLSAGEVLTTELLHQKDYTAKQLSIMNASNEAQKSQTQNLKVEQIGVVQLDNNKVFKELIQTSPAIADKIKQKAGVELPGAEEEDKHETAIVKEEHASGQKKYLANPRLSLLLSLAPDFSSTSFNQYTAPGEAFGVMIHYHVKNAWSISAGIVKSNKKYTGDGEAYKPPTGYWKIYTNGIIPQSIEGSCSILEIPIMLQYSVAESGRSKFLLGAGVSNYIMLNESYRYNFEQPNPGSKEGWNSKNTSSFLFNMVNFTIGFERQILPGFMIGIEPYVKVPIEEIGWLNLKLFSTGASFTLRYIILKKEYSPLPARSRGPD